MLALLAVLQASADQTLAQVDQVDNSIGSAPASDSFADALERINDELSRQPGQITARFERARLLEARGLPDAAMQDYRWLLNHRPELPEAYNNMARLLAARGELSQAISLLEQGLSTHPVYQLMFANLRALYESMARQAYRAALNEPTSPDEVVPVDEAFSVKLRGVESMSMQATADETTGAASPDSTATRVDTDNARVAARGE